MTQSMNVAYAGMIDFHIRTLTTTYPSFNNQPTWDFNQHALWPMEFHGFQTPAAMPVGLWAQLLDLSGYTTISVGDNTPSKENTQVFGSPVWQGDTFSGWTIYGPGTVSPAIYSYPAIIGQNITAPFYGFRYGTSLGSGQPNTYFPNAYSSYNWPGGPEFYSGSCMINAQQYSMIATQTGASGLYPFGVTDYPIAIHNVIGPNVQVKDLSDPNSRFIYIFTDFISQKKGPFAVTFINPPGNADIDTTYIQGLNFTQATPQGFLLLSKNTVTVEGMVLNGYGILVHPSFTSYRILRFVPNDATAAAWNTVAGLATGKIDKNGIFWMHNVIYANTLFTSVPSMLLLPIYFPVPEPEGFDAEPNILMMRSVTNAE